MKHLRYNTLRKFLDSNCNGNIAKCSRLLRVEADELANIIKLESDDDMYDVYRNVASEYTLFKLVPLSRDD